MREGRIIQLKIVFYVSFSLKLPFLKDSSGKTYQVDPAVFVHSAPSILCFFHF